MDSTRHAGNTAIVTGAGSGIGRACVLQLAGEGARVVGCDVSADGLAVTTEQLAAAGLEATLLTADVTLQGDVDRVVAAAEGRVDLLANVAGVMDHFLPLDEVDDATWEQVLGVNLTGVMRLTRAVLPLMREAGSGAVVTVASEASLRAGSAGVAYTCSKHAVVGLVQHVAYLRPRRTLQRRAAGAGRNRYRGDRGTALGVGHETCDAVLLGHGAVGAAGTIATAISWLGCDEARNVNRAILAADGDGRQPDAESLSR